MTKYNRLRIKELKAELKEMVPTQTENFINYRKDVIEKEIGERVLVEK